VETAPKIQPLTTPIPERITLFLPFQGIPNNGQPTTVFPSTDCHI
jgi:hypothetical protein